MTIGLPGGYARLAMDHEAMDYDWSVLDGTDPASAARALLGCRLSANGVTVRLTEVEAYGGVGADPASHAHRGRTRRNTVMFGPAGVLYVYFTYGMHWCMNVVTGPVGEASAVLLRAGEVVDGLDAARTRRSRASGPPRDIELARGPARLAIALGVVGSMNGLQLLRPDSAVRLEARTGTVNPARIRNGPRVGITVATDTPWRYWLDGEPSVSAYRPRSARGRTV